MNRIGSMWHRVVIQSNSTTVNAVGEQIDSWSTAATVYAEITAASSRDRDAAGARAADATHRVRMRYRSDVTVSPAQRLSYGSRTFAVLSAINHHERHRWLDVLAREIT